MATRTAPLAFHSVEPIDGAKTSVKKAATVCLLSTQSSPYPTPEFPVLQPANHEKITALFLIVGLK